MMKRILAGVAVVFSVAAAQAADAGFKGFYVGAKLGYNDSNTSVTGSTNHGSAFLGAEAGYSWIVSDNSLLGFDVWGDDHKKSVSGRDYGMDMKLGSVDFDRNVMYYLKLGLAATYPGIRTHYGAGVEYKFRHQWGALAELTGDTKARSGVNYTNANFVAGLTYHF